MIKFLKVNYRLMPGIIPGLITTRTEEIAMAETIMTQGTSMPAKTFVSALLELANPRSKVSE